jgi:hypothetical protein
MLRFEVRKERFDVTDFPVPSFLEALPDGLVRVYAGGDIEQVLGRPCPQAPTNPTISTK